MSAIIAAMLLLVLPDAHAGNSDTPTMLSSRAAPRGSGFESVYIALPEDDEDELTRIYHELDRAGARRIHAFMPDLIVCEVPPGVSAAAVAGPRAVVVPASEAHKLEVMDLAVRPALLERERRRTRYQREGSPTPSPSQPAAYRSGVREIPLDAIYRSVARADRVNALLPSSAAGSDEARLLHQESEFLVGTIVVNLVLPDSDYPEVYWEEWREETLENAHLGMYFAMNDFMEEFDNADIGVIYKYYDQVYITAEPTRTEPANDSYWITLTMAALEYPGPESEFINTVHEFNDDSRRKHGADWAFTAFIALAEKKERWSGATFWNARFLSWGYRGGPYWVTSYPAGAHRGYQGVRTIARHEIGHIFWGLEEHFTPESTCDDLGGYLAAPNGNKVLEYSEFGGRRGCDGFDHPIPCVMNVFDQIEIGIPNDACEYTQGHWGVADVNENNVPDALDRAPIIEFDAADVETVTTSVRSFNVLVTSLPVPNQNAAQPPELRRDYAARIRDISVAVGGLAEYTLEPRDIGSDGYQGSFRVDLPPLIPGRLDINVQARNEYNATSPLRTKQYRYVHLKYLGFERTNPNEGIRLKWRMLGELFGARFDVHRRNEDTGEEAVLATAITPVAPTEGGVTSFDFLDDTAAPGVNYTYWVTGTIDLPNSAGNIHKVVASTPVPAQGAVTRDATPASTISNLAPNPFTTETWLSLNVPHVPRTPPGGGNTVDKDTRTRVTIVIYDVLGRRVNELYRRDVVDDVVTLSWDGTDGRGRPLPSGVYFVRVEVGSLREIRKVMLIR